MVWHLAAPIDWRRRSWRRGVRCEIVARENTRAALWQSGAVDSGDVIIVAEYNNNTHGVQGGGAMSPSHPPELVPRERAHLSTSCQHFVLSTFYLIRDARDAAPILTTPPAALQLPNINVLSSRPIVYHFYCYAPFTFWSHLQQMEQKGLAFVVFLFSYRWEIYYLINLNAIKIVLLIVTYI